ncbi:hypothetical protein ABZ682_39890 [Streptomyces griseoviridis]|uniref:hypothetical protein n=1 Tax=Streptomyces TaxID=1883 RepID=UPI002476C9D7|nr:hypothetical protein [Streptomyces sp. MAA16]MDH6701375.1 hypothetical protein [Streptomyces sp. MAA16]
MPSSSTLQNMACNAAEYLEIGGPPNLEKFVIALRRIIQKTEALHRQIFRRR